MQTAAVLAAGIKGRIKFAQILLTSLALLFYNKITGITDAYK
ncbi:MAG: hypothetical protein RHS_2351 [Robinsoniella sp. RHS]|nr:MAG: hypothetical protein RHS_2351 [Robinsoniella sp. RHS]